MCVCEHTHCQVLHAFLYRPGIKTGGSLRPTVSLHNQLASCHLHCESLLEGIHWLNDIEFFCHMLTDRGGRRQLLLTFHTHILTFIRRLSVVICARRSLPLRLVGADPLLRAAVPLIELVTTVICSAPTIIALVRVIIHCHLQSNWRLLRANLLIIAVPTLPLPVLALQPVHTGCQMKDLLLKELVLSSGQCRW